MTQCTRRATQRVTQKSHKINSRDGEEGCEKVTRKNPMGHIAPLCGRNASEAGQEETRDEAPDSSAFAAALAWSTLERMSANVPPFVDAVVQEARRLLAVDRVWLFGSRARGDARELSDYDLAFDHQASDAAWCAFVNLVQDEASTLADLDLVDLRQASRELRARILKEGVLLHG